MFNALAFFNGMMLAVMLQMNQGLSTQYGAYRAALYIHLVGVLFSTCILLRKGTLRSAFRRVPWWMYLGGVFSVITMVCNNLSYGQISLTSIMSLGIFAQLGLSMLMDRFGWLGTSKSDGGGLLGMAVSAVGILWMLDTSVQNEWLYLLLSLTAGAAVIFTRVFNAELASRIGVLQSSLLNDFSGLPLCLLFTLCAGESAAHAAVQPWMWFGGVIGALNVIVCNLLVPKLSASLLTMLSLCGQLLCGILLDLLCSRTLNTQEFFASLCIAAGILCSHLTKLLKVRKKAVLPQP